MSSEFGGVGTSLVTPGKHCMLRVLALSEITSALAVVNAIRARTGAPYMCNGHLLIDLTAGDAAGDGVNTWWRGSSPAIFAYIASKYRMVRVRLYELDRFTFHRLVANLACRLSGMGFIQLNADSWIHQDTASTLTAHCGDARVLEDFGDLRPYEWLFVNNDPNTMHAWALNMAHLARAMATMQGQVCVMSTIGCGTRVKMVPLEHREPIWLPPIEQTVELCQAQPRLDLMLRRLGRWAYLLLMPANKAMPTLPGMVDLSWRRSRSAFEAAINELVYSERQRADGHGWQSQVRASDATFGTGETSRGHARGGLPPAGV
jgi:hypothetical protein